MSAPAGMVKGVDAMPYSLRIRRVSDGAESFDPHHGEWWLWPEGSTEPFSMDFWWTDGNGGCDCNREIFFARARGEPDPDFDGICCGDGAYVVKCVAADGEVLLDEIGKEPQ